MFWCFAFYRCYTGDVFRGSVAKKQRLRTVPLRIVGAVAAGNIIESGSNTNGQYTKYADGTMICWGSVKMFLGTPDTWVTGTYEFPAAFSSIPVGMGYCAGMGTSAAGVINVVNGGVSQSAFVMHIGASSGWQGAQVDVNYTATGRWKA